MKTREDDLFFAIVIFVLGLAVTFVTLKISADRRVAVALERIAVAAERQ